jgi:Ca2+-binding RTX toxin-like protein
MRAHTPAIIVVALLASGLTATAASAAGTATVRCHGVQATIVGTDRSEILTGTPHRDVIAGRGGSDTIHGRGGNDLICAGYGADRLDGGRGDDRLRGGPDRIIVTEEGTERLGDVLAGGPGDDNLRPGVDQRPADDINPDVLSWEAAAGGPVSIDLGAGTATGEGHDEFDASHATVVGSSYDDTIVGGAGSDRILAGPGSDLVRARGGADQVYDDADHQSGRAADVIRGGAGDDQLSATFGRDQVFGGSGNDFIDDFDNKIDAIHGNAGHDHVVGEIVAAAGVQHYYGGAGNDEVGFFTNHINPTAAAATGHWDMATGAVSYQLGDTEVGMVAQGFEAGDFNTYGTAWTVDGGPRDDTVTASGTTGTTFHGLDGDDSFSGSASDDVFDGGPGTDHSLGMGEGNDTCISVEIFDDATCENLSG